MTLKADGPEWTIARLDTLVAAVEHLLPIAEACNPSERSQAAEAVRAFVIETLSNPKLESQRSFLWAALDELDELASAPSSDSDATNAGQRGLAECSRSERERLLRRLEADTNPYLAHAVPLLLQLTLEGFLGDPNHGGNPKAIGWTSLGLTPLGPRRRLGTKDFSATRGHD